MKRFVILVAMTAAAVVGCDKETPTANPQTKNNFLDDAPVPPPPDTDPTANPQTKNNFLRPESNSEDDVLARKLVGTWEGAVSQDGVGVSGPETYFPDGTYTLAGTLTLGSKKSAISVTATWRVEGKKLHLKITHSSVPDLLPVGKTITDEIVKLTEDELVIRDPDDGTTETCRRVSK